MDSVMGFFFQNSANKQVEEANKGIQDVFESTSDTVTRWWNSMAGATQKPLSTVLDEYNIPRGVFPKNHSKYKIENEENGTVTLTVVMPEKCEVKFSDGQVVQFNKQVSCTIADRMLTEVIGIRTQGTIRWIDVDAIVIKDTKIEFVGGGGKKSRDISVYRNAREGVDVLAVK